MSFKRVKKIDHSPSHRGYFLSKLSTLILASILGVFLLTVITVIIFITQIPSPEELTNRDLAKATKIYDKDGELLYDIFKDQNRTPVKIEDVPEVVKEATIAIEDKDFYKHQGFSFTGLVRGLIVATVTEGRPEGGSTLTQQLVKNALLSGERSLTRKIKEFILAVQVERAYSKDQILEFYLNEIPYGGTAYGIEAAANLYFGKHANELNLAEGSLLAGLPQRPSVYSPYGSSPELGRGRQAEVLRRMVEDGYITQEEADKAADSELTFRTAQQEVGFKAPHFVLYVKKKLEEQFGTQMVEGGGLRVTTTLDYKLQEKAETIVKEEVEKLSKFKVGNGAAIVLDPKNGAILSMVGSKDYFSEDYDGNVNVTTSDRQPGSATKPITYAKGLQKNYTAATMIMDVRTDFPGGIGQPTYTPRNYDGRVRGPIQVRYALGNSLNIPAVKMLAMVGIQDVMDLAFRMGLTNWEPSEENINNVGLSLTLGGREVKLLELASAYGVFAAGGVKHDPISILKVTDSGGKVLFEYKDSEGTKILEPEVAFIISDILHDNGARSATFGPSSLLVIPNHTVSVKTGTTDDKRDNWTFGFTKSRVVGAWIGNNDNTSMDPRVESGAAGASLFWNKIIKASLEGISNEPFDRPSGVVQVDIDGLTGGTPKDGSPQRKEYFIKGTEPTSQSAAYQNKKVCKNNNHRLANDNEDGDQKDVIILQENDPTGANNWQRGIDSWVLTAGDPRFVGATTGCSGIPSFTTSGGAISIVNVSNGANVPRVFDVLASVNSGNGVKQVTWFIDGGQRAVNKVEPYALHVEFPQGDTGSHTITATLEDNSGATFSTSIGVTVSM